MPSYHGKRAFDLTLVLLASPLWLPLIVIVAFVVRLRLGAPVFFRQARAGLNDQPFNVLKFRTMTDDRDGAALPETTGDPPPFCSSILIASSGVGMSAT